MGERLTWHRYRYVPVVIAAGILAFPAAAQGWQTSSQDGLEVYELASGDTAVVVSPWQPLAGADPRELLSAALANSPHGFKTGAQLGEIEASSPTGALQVSSQGTTASGALGIRVSLFCSSAQDRYRLVEIVGSAEDLGQESVSDQASEIAARACLDQQSPAQVAEAPAPAAESVAATAPAALPSDLPSAEDIAGIWAAMSYGVTGAGSFGLTETFYLTFKNGEVTSDVSEVFEDGVSATKQAGPDDWGHWQKSGDKIQVQMADGQGLADAQMVYPLEPGKKGERLAGCFATLATGGNIAYGGNTMAAVSSDYCFSADGTVRHGRAAGVTSGNDYTGESADMAASSSQHSAGRYQIDGHILTLTWNDGSQEKKAFGFLNEERTHILIGETRYMQ